MQTSPEPSPASLSLPPFLGLICIRLRMRGEGGGVMNVYMTYIKYEQVPGVAGFLMSSVLPFIYFF